MDEGGLRRGVAGGGAVLMDALRAAADGLAGGDPAAAWQLSEQELAEALGLVGRVRTSVERIEVAVAGEAIQRGIGACGGRTEVDWALHAEAAGAPRPEVRDVARVFRVARACARPGMAVLAEAFERGALPLEKADRIVGFEERVRRVADPDQVEEQVGILVEAARDTQDEHGVVSGLTVRELGQAIRYATALLRSPRELEHDEERMRAARTMRSGPGPGGMTAYHLLLDPEGAAAVDAAVAALSAPQNGPDGRRDPRTPAARRADALLEVVRRGVGAPGAMPKCEKAQVVVTVSLESLVEQVEHAGLTGGGQVLSAGTIRRMACDASIIPMVLGSDGEVLDLGRQVRLFTPGQRRAIVRRDGGCTFPDCTMPADWCEAHHVTWWSRGGDTDLENAALLCGRHHTVVHRRDLTATVTKTGVTWHLDPTPSHR